MTRKCGFLDYKIQQRKLILKWKKRSLEIQKSRSILRSLFVLLSLSIIFIFIFLIIRNKRRTYYDGQSDYERKRWDRKLKKSKEESKDCQLRHQRAPNGSDSLRFYKEWECDYCKKIFDLPWKDKVKITDGKAVIEIKNSKEFPEKEEFLSNLITCEVSGHLQGCEEAKKYGDFLDSKKDNILTYDDNQTLKKKGYRYEAVNQVSRWTLLDRVILPDLKEKNRRGVVKVLCVSSKMGAEITNYNNLTGRVSDLIIFLTPRVIPITNQNFEQLLKGEQKLDFFYTIHGSKITATHEEIVASFFIWRVLQKEESWNYNIFLLENNCDYPLTSKATPNIGWSAGVAWYLALLSAYYQKPISKEVAATAAIDVGKIRKSWCVQCFQENKLAKNIKKNFSQNKITRIDSLPIKVKAAVEAGVKKLILSTEQKEDYEKNIWDNSQQKEPNWTKT